MNVFLFPGQGSQSVGMGADLLRGAGPTRCWIRQASELAGTDLERVLLRGPEAELARPEFVQPLLVCISLGYLAAARERGLAPGLVLGHSLGEVTTLAAAGVLRADDAVRVAARRGALMAEAARPLHGGLLAVSTPDRRATLAHVQARPGQPVVLANDNSPEQLVFSGPRAELETLATQLPSLQLGRCRLLPVAGPWHHPLMSGAQASFAAWLQDVPFLPPSVPLWMNASGQAESEPARIRSLLAANLTGSVPWRCLMEHLAQSPDLALFEVGPGRVLCGLARANGMASHIPVQPLGSLRAIESLAPRPGDTGARGVTASAS